MRPARRRPAWLFRPTEVVLFGNARGGTPLMADQRTAGIDLPLKCLVSVWQDEAGKMAVVQRTVDRPSSRAGTPAIAA